MARRKTVNDLSFKSTPGGDLELDGFEDGDVFEDPFEVEDKEEEEEEEGEEEGEEGDEEEFEEEEFEEDQEEKEDKASKGIGSRLDKLEGMMQNLMLALATGDKPSKKKADEDEDDEDEELPDELDNKTLVKVLSKKIDKTINQRFNQEMGKHAPALEQANINSQFQRLAATHGQKFVDAIPTVARIMLKGDIRDAEKAYAIFLTTGGGRVSKKVSAQKEVAKIRRRTVDADSRDSVGEMRHLPPRTQFKQLKGSDGDIFERAFNSAVVDAARGAGRRRR